VDGFYEWKKVPGGKIPYSISMKDDSPFVFAGFIPAKSEQPTFMLRVGYNGSAGCPQVRAEGGLAVQPGLVE
jgi:putative SOS response-associated peptidase YedK